MTTPVITDFPLPFPAKGQSDTDFDNNVDAYLSWLSGTNVPELQIALPWVQARLEEVAATALSGTLPDISAQALNLLRVNAGASAVEFRTPAQVLADIGAATSASVALKAPLASPALTGTPTAPTAAAATNTTQIATTAMVQAAIAWRYTSAQTSLPAASSFIAFAHGLGVRPTRHQVVAQCVIAQNGYAVADEFIITGYENNGTTEQLGTVSVNATSVFYSSAGNGTLAVVPRGGGTAVQLTNANWRLVARASL